MFIHHNLLAVPLIGVTGTDGTTTRHNLPDVLARLGRDDVLAFTALAPYQAHPWHAFLVQLAALALHRAGETDPRRDAESWRKLLRGLTPACPGDEPWSLVVEDLAQPAFLQPPVPEKSLAKFKGVSHPDELDVLLTAKNHDLKAARVARPSPDHWLFALLSLQTMQGFLGAGNYGISRMNGGFASRPAVGLVTSHEPGERWLRDTAVLLQGRAETLRQYSDYAAKGGVALVWMEPWAGTSSLALNQLDPWYIEICRRVRLAEGEGGIVAWVTSTKSARIAAQALKGMTGDPWTPLDAAEGKALTISQAGFDYRLLQELLLGARFQRPIMQEVRPENEEQQDLFLQVRALARGQGETNGYHERLLPIPPSVRHLLFRGASEERRSAGQVSQTMVAQAGDVRGKVLRPALFALFQAGPEQIAWKHKESEDWSPAWLGRFDDEVDRVFFEHLWARLETPDAHPPTEWVQTLRRLAWNVLKQTVAAAPIPAQRHFRAVAASERVFRGAFYNLHPDLIPTASETASHEEEGHERHS